jgi:Asp-tRNA(Asn)/Glu-tRNA(Gln) amidotransferase A subunit family amidase
MRVSSLAPYVSLFSLTISLAMAQSQPLPGFDAREATIESVQTAIFSGLTTCRGVVSAFITRIEAFNPEINAIITLNPNALNIADEMDLALANGNATGAFFGVPVLVKDNYDALPMNTTGGCLALRDSIPTIDAPTITALIQAGAIILGKANLHELALEGLSVSSYGGQTINPYDHTRTPGGSSGGTGAAIAASLAVFGTGTDTVNSLRSPASANSLFSFRPTRGLISRAGVIPISYTQDAVGAIGRSVADIAKALTVMASVGYDSNDNTTSLRPDSVDEINYSARMLGGSLFGLRLGLIEGFFNRTATNETTPVNDAMDHVASILTAAGATVIKIDDPIYNATAIQANHDVQQYEYQQELSAYLQRPSLQGNHPASMPDLYKNSSGNFLVIPAQYSYVNNALVSSTANATYAGRSAGDLIISISTAFKQHNLDAFIYPEQKNLVVKIGSPSQSGRNGILAAVTGSPVVTVPIGFSPVSENAPIGVPIGMEIFGLPWTEGKLLQIARLLDEKMHVRRMPVYCNASLEVKSYERVPVVRPDSGNVDMKAYPLGTL